ncbi:hypothetical protein JI435_417290 [Parastagonospora nodorum SN15]|uniref:Uncharacterized protein n=1 Tax=Phaeosphaeria nodorum (strain SN15 / ATCC MYA-4574 / FGSC 10173) TaxID=321614 RepID=A0A7U2FAU2_PHANO|nr:hypothetical protein JI435_417290 [Parastagonospora nodorum SN15]
MNNTTADEEVAADIALATRHLDARVRLRLPFRGPESSHSQRLSFR